MTALDLLTIGGASFAVPSVAGRVLPTPCPAPTSGGGAPVQPLSDCDPLPVHVARREVARAKLRRLAGVEATAADERAVFVRALGVGR